jgi:hypothetical protein
MGISSRIMENPRKPALNAAGKKYAPTVPWQSIIAWAQEYSDTHKLLVIDPVSMIDYDTGTGFRSEAREQDKFFRELIASVYGTDCTVLCVHHVIKRTGKNANLPLTLDDMAGSSSFGRAAHNVLLLDVHDERDSDVLWCGVRKSVTHRRTMCIAKTRDGDGQGIRLACDLAHDAPRIDIHGPIIPKGR